MLILNVLKISESEIIHRLGLKMNAYQQYNALMFSSYI